MDDHLKTKAQLIAELEVLRAQVASFQQSKEPGQSETLLLTHHPLSTINCQSLQILLVEDSEIARNIYKRFLKQNCDYNYQVIEFGLGEEALTWCQYNQPDILLLDYILPDMNGLEFLIKFRKSCGNHQCPALIITGQGSTEIAVEFFKQGAQDYIDKSQITADSLNRSVTKLVQKTQLLQEQKWQQQRQQLIAKTALSIRQSLNLTEILKTTVTEIRQTLQSDRVIVYQFQPNRTGIIIQESVSDPTLSLLGMVIPEEHFPSTWVTPYQQGHIRVIQNIDTDPDLSDCHREFLQQLLIRSNLIVPLLLRDHLWGLLIAHHCTTPRYWTANEVTLMQELATQVSIAIQQVTLLEELQQELLERKQAEVALQNMNTELEQQVKKRTKILTKINTRLQEELIIREIMEKELKKQEQLLKSFFDAASVANIGLGIQDNQLRFVQVNQALADMNGCSIEAHLHHSVSELLPHLAPKVLPLLQQVLETGEALSNLEIGMALPQQPQVMRYWLVSYFPVPGNTKNQNAIGNIIIEISDRKRIEIEREKLIDILEVTSDIVGTASVNTLGIEYLNLSGRRMFGFPEQTPIDQLSIPDIHPQWAFSLLRDQGIPTAIREGVWMGETAILKPNGEEIPVSQVILAHTFGTNQVQFISTIIRNITQQKQTEATLRESNRRWQSLLDNVQLIVVGLDRHSQVEYVNPFFLKLTGYSEAEVLGKVWFDQFIPPRQRLEVNKTFQNIIASHLHPYYQNSILTQSGEERIIAWNNTLLQDVEGQPIGIISIGEDITERYQLERMKAEFISIVSHELRTPLTSMQAGLSLLHSNIIAPQSPEGQITLDIAMTGVNRLVRLVNDILDLERLESGKIRLAIRPCDVTILINTAIAQMQELANQGGIVLESQTQPFEIDADPDRLLQVLINLLSNGIKFSPDGSVISLSVNLYQSSSGDEQPTINPHLTSTSNKIYHPITSQFLLFAIRDQGRGIPKENLDSIFERFHQVDSSDSREKGGTGLGLAICRSIIQQHGGQIWVESRLQAGSTFYFTIPINHEASSYY